MIALIAALLLSGQAPPAAVVQPGDEEAAPAPAPAQPETDAPVPPPPPEMAAPDYDTAVRAAARTALGRQGQLEGGWSVRGSDGLEIFRFELREPAIGQVEGAWRDMTSGPSPTSSGLLSAAGWDGPVLRLRFTQHDAADLLAVTLTAAGDHWSGEIWRAGKVTRVEMTRR